VSLHALVDKTAALMVVVVAAVLAPEDLASARPRMRGLCVATSSRWGVQQVGGRAARGPPLAKGLAPLPVS